MRRGAPAALPQGWACASEGRLWILKEPREPARPQRESEAGIQPRACARGAGRRGWAVRGAGGGVGGSEGKRFLVPAERGESGSAPRRREELSVCSALLPSSPPLLLPPPAPSREVLAAERRRAGRDPGQPARGQPRAPSLRPSLHPSRALSPRPRGAGPRDSRTARRTAHRSTGRAEGAGGGHVLPGQEKHPAHHGKPGPAPPRGSSWDGGGRRQGRDLPGDQGGPRGLLRRGGWGGAGLALQPPPPASGDNGGRGSPARRGGAGASGPSPHGLAAPSPHPTGCAGWRGLGGCGAEQKREGRGGRTPFPGPWS